MISRRVFSSVDEIEAAVGESLGVSEWRTLNQDAVNDFASVTDDHQWIHVDVERVKGTPLGGTIVHGYFTLALLPAFARELYAFETGSARLNYGLDKVRFPAPLPVGSRVRAGAVLKGLRQLPAGHQVAVSWTVEVEGSPRPVCVAESITLLTA